jgi:CheY-like chemotaxis protein
MLGVQEKDLLGTNLARFITIESLGNWYLHCQAGFSNEEKQMCEIRMRRTDNTLLSLRAESIGARDGSEGHFRTTLVDISQEKLEAVAKARDRLISSVSHELRSSLTPIVGWSSLLSHKTLNKATFNRGLESIERNAELQKQLIDDLVHLSDNFAGNTPVTFRPLEHPGIINPAVSLTTSYQNCATPFDGWHILVVDDETDTLDMLKAVFETTRAEVRTSTNLSDALQTLQEWKADALISDLDMSNGEGYALIDKVRALEKQRTNHVLAIALTADVQAEDRTRAFDAGFDVFVAKPIAPHDLFAAVSGNLRMAA